jgi:glycerol transport system permease protein
MEKTTNHKAWFLVLPVLVLVAFSAVIPLMTVVNYSVQDTFGNNQFFWAGTEWFRDMLRDDRMWDALGRQLLFSGIILLIQIPLGVFIALNMPKRGFWVSFCLVVMSLPLLIPWNVVGTIWQIFGRVDIGLLGYTLAALGIDYNYTSDPFAAWVTIIVMDVWHWTSLVALLAYAGLKSIPDAYYQAAKIDQASRWAVFRYIELPKMMGVLMIAVLLRFMDSFMIYTEPFVVTGGGPGSTTTMLSIDLVKMALGQFDLGPAAAFSIMYFLVILLISWVFYTVMTNLDKRGAERMADVTQSSSARGLSLPKVKSSTIVMALYLIFLMLPIYWLLNMSLKTNTEIVSSFSLIPAEPTLENYRTILTDPAWYTGYINSLIYVVMNTVISLAVALPAAYAFSAITSWATSICFSGC